MTEKFICIPTEVILHKISSTIGRKFRMGQESDLIQFFWEVEELIASNPFFLPHMHLSPHYLRSQKVFLAVKTIYVLSTY